MKQLSFIYLAVLLTAQLMIGLSCGGGGGGSGSGPVTGTITTDGGSLTTPDGKMTLTIPAGALDADTEITITPIETDFGTVYEFLPEGLVFNEAATAVYDMDLNDWPAMVDENGDSLDLTRDVPDVLSFLINNDDDTVEAIETSNVSRGTEGTTVTTTVSIPHFTSMISAAGNGAYAYLTSVGTHYVGPTFKLEATFRYLGFETTSSYKGSSITNKVNSITVTKKEFEVTGAIKIDSPNPLDRNDFLSQVGDEASTRPRFHCDEVGDGTVKYTVTATAVVEVTFQPENRTRVFNVAINDSSTRKGKCIASCSFADPAETETRVALNDPTGDVQVDEGNTGILVPASDAPSNVDTEVARVSVLDDDHLAVAIQVGADVPASNPDNVSFASYDLLVLDSSIGDTIGIAPFADGLWDLSIDASGTGTVLEPTVYMWNGSTYVEVPDLDLEGVILGQCVVMEIPLDSLGMTADEARAASYRAVTQQILDDMYFIDSLDLDFSDAI